MKVFGNLAIDLSTVLAVAVVPAEDGKHTAQPEEIGLICLHNGSRFEVSGASASQLIAFFADAAGERKPPAAD